MLKHQVGCKTTSLCRLFSALLASVGGNRTRPSGLLKPQATAELKQAIASLPLSLCFSVRQKGIDAAGCKICRNNTRS
ncbi:MAG TPA: hypothetical protein VGJ90_04705 [Methylophilaceae bacterium]